MKHLVLALLLFLSFSSAAFEIDAHLLDSIARAESGYNPKAVSRVGARGKYQFMEKTWVWLWTDILKEPENADFEKAFDPNISEKACKEYLKWIKSTLNKKGLASKENVVAAYNAGVGSVIKYKGIPPFKETQNYVKKVLNKK